MLALSSSSCRGRPQTEAALPAGDRTPPPLLAGHTCGVDSGTDSGGQHDRNADKCPCSCWTAREKRAAFCYHLLLFYITKSQSLSKAGQFIPELQNATSSSGTNFLFCIIMVQDLWCLCSHRAFFERCWFDKETWLSESSPLSVPLPRSRRSRFIDRCAVAVVGTFVQGSEICSATRTGGNCTSKSRFITNEEVINSLFILFLDRWFVTIS